MAGASGGIRACLADAPVANPADTRAASVTLLFFNELRPAKYDGQVSSDRESSGWLDRSWREVKLSAYRSCIDCFFEQEIAAALAAKASFSVSSIRYRSIHTEVHGHGKLS
jgi:hypothetical protein